EVADPAVELRTAGDAAAGGDMRAVAHREARRDVAEVVDDRVLSDDKMLGDSNTDVRGDDRQGCDPTTPKPVSATGSRPRGRRAARARGRRASGTRGAGRRRSRCRSARPGPPSR